MKFFLLKMSVSGIKNIEKEVELNFFNSTLKKKFNPSKSHVKAVYGTNGAGKTALIYAVDIYKNLVLDSRYLTVNNDNGSLDCLINQKTREFKIKMTFICEHEYGKNKVYSHSFVIKKINNEFRIEEEKLSELSGLNLNAADKYSVVYKTEGGKLAELHKKFKSTENLKNETMNLLSSQSFLCAAIVPHVKNRTIDKCNMDEDLLLAALLTMTFASCLTVVLQNSDRFIDYNELLWQFNDMLRGKIVVKDTGGVAISSSGMPKLRYLETQRVPKERFEEHEKNICNLCSFIKVFNGDLESIEIKKDENGDYYECENILVYKDKRISEKYESTGIKKLIKLYSALCDLENGMIVFIDEFDANLHDVLLEKLVQYIMLYSKGQFIFTTHNLGPMDILQKANNSIDFLSSDSRIVSWVKNGNYTAASQYKKGLIKYSPFNVEPFSFLGVFGDEQK